MPSQNAWIKQLNDAELQSFLDHAESTLNIAKASMVNAQIRLNDLVAEAHARGWERDTLDEE